jgi:hypothetical protein
VPVKCSRCGEKLEDGSCICRQFRTFEDEELGQLDCDPLIAEQPIQAELPQPDPKLTF